jgi:hypothetical protein
MTLYRDETCDKADLGLVHCSLLHEIGPVFNLKTEVPKYIVLVSIGLAINLNTHTSCKRRRLREVFVILSAYRTKEPC